MVKLDNKALATLGSSPAVPGGGFLKEVNATINNLRDFIKLAKSMQGGDNQDVIKDDPPPMKLNSPGAKETPPAPPDPAKAAAAILAAVLDLGIKAELGEKTVKELLDLAAPFTVNQLRGFLK